MRNLVGPLFSILMFALALMALHHLLREHHFHDILTSARSISSRRLVVAALLTLLGYVVLSGYDALALRYAEHRLAYPKVALTAFLAYACSMNLGFAPITGSAVRFRLYSGWGLTAVQIAKVAVFAGLVMWLGFLTLCGVVFVIEPMTIPMLQQLQWMSSRFIGAVFLALVGGLLLLLGKSHGPVRLRNWQITAPNLSHTLLGMVVSCTDWCLAAAVLFAFSPDSLQLGYTAFLGVFLLAQATALISHVPGGLGVFESVLLLLLQGRVDAPGMVGALLAFRAIYYLAPFGVAVVALSAIELIRRGPHMAGIASAVGHVTAPIVPRALALLMVLGGAILLFSGATPALPERVAWLRRIVPLSFMELSHFAGSVCGAALVVLARSIQRRIDAAFWLTGALLLLGILASLFKGFDYEEAIALTLILGALISCRAHFHRKAALTSTSFSPAWITAILAIVGGTVWLGVFSYKHIEYTNDLWWHFSYAGNASRFLRACAGIAGVLIVVAAARLLRPAAPRRTLPTRQELDLAAGVVAREPRTTGNYALFGDKLLLFNANHDALIAYGVHGRSWVAMGGVIGPPPARAELIWDFLERVDRHGGWPVFYEARPDELSDFAEAGLSAAKLGESARVDLGSFSLEGKAHKDLRQVVNRIAREHCRFEVVPPQAVPAILPRLRIVSDHWLAQKHVREKRFSIGYFDETYLMRYNIGLVRAADETIVAFANIWCGADAEEISIDLMRHVDTAPKSVMEYLFTQIALWGQSRGYRWFDLGMAPLSGLHEHPLAPTWNRVGNYLFSHAEHFYNFEGLRQYKEKFDPQWEPRYLVYPGGIMIARILLDCAALSAGGMRGVIFK